MNDTASVPSSQTAALWRRVLPFCSANTQFLRTAAEQPPFCCSANRKCRSVRNVNKISKPSQSPCLFWYFSPPISSVTFDKKVAGWNGLGLLGTLARLPLISTGSLPVWSAGVNLPRLVCLHACKGLWLRGSLSSPAKWGHHLSSSLPPRAWWTAEKYVYGKGARGIKTKTTTRETKKEMSEICISPV